MSVFQITKWPLRRTVASCTLLVSLLASSFSFAADGRVDYDIDNDGLIEINDLADLDEIRNNLDGKTLYASNAGCPDAEDGTVNGGCNGFELTGDLDFDTNQDGVMDSNDTYWDAGSGWFPIGRSSSIFSSIFEGDGHTIRNLYINRSNFWDVGLFGQAHNASIQNLILTGPLMSVTGKKNVGSLVGYLNLSQINSIMNTGSVQGEDATGGLVGISISSSISNTMNTGFVQGTKSLTGGLVGHLASSNITNSLNSGFVFGTLRFSGGLVGYASSNTIINSYWAIDSSGQATSHRQSEATNQEYEGVRLSILQCPIDANTDSTNSDCTGLSDSVTLFKEWDQATHNGQNIWDFGSAEQLPALVLNGMIYRDSDGDGMLDNDDIWPNERAASNDADSDGHPDRWTIGCDDVCIANSGLTLDQFPANHAAWQDDDLDGLPDSWIDSCDDACQTASGLVLDARPNDTDNDGLSNLEDNDDNNDGFTDVDADSDGLIDINSLAQLNAMRYQLDGSGLRLTSDAELNKSGCPAILYLGKITTRCIGYELILDLDFDTNNDGIMDDNDDYWGADSNGVGRGWTPVGGSYSRFKAVFEGNGHAIHNLYIHNRGYESGLFGYTQQAELRNVVLTGPLMSINSGGYTGSLVGYSQSSIIINCMNTGPVKGTRYAGGLVGSAVYSSQISNSLNTGSVQSEDRAGGLVGILDSSHVSNSLSASYASSHRAVGVIGGFSANSSITNSYWVTNLTSLETLQCPIKANTNSTNSNCEIPSGSLTLYNNWDQASYNGQTLWHFGTEAQLPALALNDTIYRDSDGDGSLDTHDVWPNNRAASFDNDNDGYPDRWTQGCDDICISNSGLVLDQFPMSNAAWQNDDLDDLPDAWAANCDTTCQANSGLVLDEFPNDTDNDGLTNQEDSDDNNDGVTDVDADSDGLIEINSLELLNAIRYQLNGTGLRLTDSAELVQTGCPIVLYQGKMSSQCKGYELTTDLDFDTNLDGLMNSSDNYWNANGDGIGEGWRPIGRHDQTFNAIFEGNGHTIRNLYINRAYWNLGLFGATHHAELRNIVLTGPLMLISNRQYHYTGSLVGGLSFSQISNVINTGSVQSSGDYTGGLVGFSRSSQISNSINTGSVQGPKYAGGLVGSIQAASQISNSFNTGSVQGDSQIGGLTGSVYSSQITKSFSSGLISGTLETGGAVGYGYHSGMTSANNYWAIDSSQRASSPSQSEGNSFVGVTLATLQCAIEANTDSTNSNCVSVDGSTEGLSSPVTLFKEWDQATNNGQPLWDFGTATQLPALVLNGTIYRDSDGDGSFDESDALPFDSDNDGISNQQDAYSFIAIGELLDTDSDGAPDTCDENCIASGMNADTDDDNDGIPDTNDAHPTISIGELTDTDSDGAPDTCDADCLALSMVADADDDNDGVLDSNDAYPLIAVGELRDTDNDGTPDTCDVDCLALGMNADNDDDNDGVLDTNDAYPLIAIGELLDTDNDGAPDTCDVDCLALGMSEDLDNDNDGVLDINDSYPLIALGDRLDSDSDGIPNECDESCITLEMAADNDDDNDGVLDTNDAFPLIAIGELIDTDNDGAPDTCDVDCLALGMSADLDDDNDGVFDSQDAYPLISLGGRLDTDSDGTPDECDENCIALGLTTDVDDDNDGVLDTNDSYPLIALGDRLDSDRDGIPNECDESCVALSMTADSDDDNDGLLDTNDAFPLIAIGELIDTDNDGAPDVCDSDCLTLGMTEDLDDDNDGVLDAQDTYPLISLGGRLDSDSDGMPDECDTTCLELGMHIDLDDDNDGVLDTSDSYPLIALGDRLDSDSDGIPNECDESCITLEMAADNDDDNDGVLDTNDAFPLIAIGELIDTDNDGAPDTCDVDCLALGMSADLDDDNDGVFDSQDAYPLISLGGRLDTDSDGTPDECDENCIALGLTTDVDDDNDGVLDIVDVYPFIAIGELLDSDNDGAPGVCDVACLNLGMSVDLDNDNDGILNTADAYPFISIGELLDTDNDGIPNKCDESCLALEMTEDLDDDNDGVADTLDRFPLNNTEHSDFDNDGTGDVADLDDDNDGVNDLDDPNQGNDNGAPEIINVPGIEPTAVTTENGDAYELLVDDILLSYFTTRDAVDTVFTYEASLNGSVLDIDENNIMLIPAGRQAIQVVAIDTSGNRSEPAELVAVVYPQVRFDQTTSIIGENSLTKIKVSLTGDAPEYPVVVTFAVNESSEVNQADLAADFDITAQHQVTIEAGDGETLNRETLISIAIIEDDESENNELLIIDLVSAKLESETDDEIDSLFVIDDVHQQHTLTVTYQNLAPVVQLKLEQNGIEVANVQQDGGLVSITAIVQDGNGNDNHMLTWDINSLGLNAPLGSRLSFDPINLPANTYTIKVTAADDGIGQLSDDILLTFDVIPEVIESEVEGPEGRETDGADAASGSGGGSGAMAWWMMLLVLGLASGASVNSRGNKTRFTY
jgi:hypothetical protein